MNRQSLILLCILAGLGLPFAALAAVTTCHEDEHGNKLCCNQWKSKVYTNGKYDGLIVEETYDQVERRVESSKKIDQMWCRNLHGASTSCNTSYGPPECAIPAFNYSSEDKTAILQNANRLIDVWLGTAADAYSKYKDLLRGEVDANPYEGVGNTLKEYGEVLNDILGQQKKLRNLLDQSYGMASDQLLSNIAELTHQSEQGIQRLQSIYHLLPGKVQQTLATGALKPNGSSGYAYGNDGSNTSNNSQYGSNPSTNSQASCPDLTNCLNLVDSIWDQHAQRMTIKVTNTCSDTVRAALWMPQGSGYSPTYFQVNPGSTATQTASGTRNQWTLQASQANASNACLRYP